MKAHQKVYVVSLGCSKNRVDTEVMLGLLAAEGISVAATLKEADVALINTCGFLESAAEEAIDTILETVRFKGSGNLKRVVVAGCFVQRYGYKLLKAIPEVDGWIGTGEIHRVAEVMCPHPTAAAPSFLINRPTRLADHQSPRVQTTPFYTAYLRVAEGCAHRCSYCLIPQLRGPFRSRAPESLLEETESLVRRGVKEINIIAQDTGVYGSDLHPPVFLPDLVERLLSAKGLEWLRLLYLHPAGLSDRLLDLIASEPTLVPYLDLPFQHVNAEILKAMGRNPDTESPLTTVERVKNKHPDICIRSTLMVGFPGETDAMFRQLCDFISRAELNHLGVFAFSPEKGTRAARLRRRVEPEVAEERRSTLMALQAGISKKKNQSLVGRTLPVLIEGPHPETDLLLCGRTATMAPEVDGQVLINEGNGIAGEIMPVTVTEAHAYDLIGRIVSTEGEKEM
ncbi:MAG: 30S ribosomal protein S12 methylthiotransferase RimO [Deltaproteobacteria bacterium]|nr:30S ribosomal protein S12 methylthiotransferase RimO [Deltaproteobacteria bacterium]